MTLPAGQDSPLVGALIHDLTHKFGSLLNHYRKGEAMLSRTVEPECREWGPVNLPEIAGAVTGADATTPTPAAILTLADDAPHPEATEIVAHATIHPTVNGAATAGCWAGSIAVN